MTKSELITKVAEKNPHLMLKDVEKIVDVFFNKIIQTLAQGDRIEFRGFGSFYTTSRSPRTAKNPRTGEKVLVGERKIPHFKTGKQLFEKLNPQ